MKISTDKTNTSQGLEVLSGLALLYETLLQEILWSETHLCTVLSSMKTRSSTDELKELFDRHQEQTFNQVGRLEKVFSLMGKIAEPLHCVGMQGLCDEGWQVIDETKDGSANRDAALIIAAQKTEHYEIAVYGSLVTLAKTLGYRDAADLLEMTLEEEKEMDSMLTLLAENFINKQAGDETVTAVTGMSSTALALEIAEDVKTAKKARAIRKKKSKED